VLGVVSPEETSPVYLAGAPEPQQAGQWTTRALQVAGKPLPEGFEPVVAIRDWAGLAEYLVAAFAWSERLTLLAGEDLPTLIGQTLVDATPEGSRPALAYLVKEGILPRPLGGEAVAGDGVTRGLLLRALHRMIRHYDAEGLEAGRFRAASPEGIGLEAGGAMVFHPLAERCHLAVDTGGAVVPLEEHTLQYGDKLRYHLSGGGEIDYLLLENRHGASDDRFSGLYTWEERISREDLAARIRERASVGELLDVIPGRRGVSGRIVDLTVRGTRGRFTFKGFSIERLLGLRETLFLVDRQYGADGKVQTFIFAGKGWGHGVGMCQVGAFGMALRGKTYEEILHHYYTGIALDSIDRIDLGLEHPLASR
jgi:stage II sporulation protein D